MNIDNMVGKAAVPEEYKQRGRKGCGPRRVQATWPENSSRPKLIHKKNIVTLSKGKSFQNYYYFFDKSYKYY